MSRVITLLLLVTGVQCFCAQIESDLPLTVLSSDSQRVVAPNEKFDVPNTGATLLHSRGHVPLLVVPLSDDSAAMKVSLKSWGDPESLPEDWWQTFDGLIADIVQVQRWMKSKRGEEALALADSLYTRFPELRQVRALKASCHLVLGQKAAAEALMKGIQDPKPAAEPERKAQTKVSEPLADKPAAEEAEAQ